MEASKKMRRGISNFQIENAIKNIQDQDLDDNFVGVFPSKHMNKFISHAAEISEKKCKYPFVIANTDSGEKGGTHWWSILDIEPKTYFFVNSFGLDGLKHFIIQDNRKIIEKILFRAEKMTRTNRKITLCNIWFNLNTYKNLSTKELDALSDTASNLFHFVQAVGNMLKLCNFVNIWMVKDRIQNLDSVICSIFQLYFYNNLFNPNENSKIQEKARLNERTIETLLNELFVLDDQETNEATIRQYANEDNISLQ